MSSLLVVVGEYITGETLSPKKTQITYILTLLKEGCYDNVHTVICLCSLLPATTTDTLLQDIVVILIVFHFKITQKYCKHVSSELYAEKVQILHNVLSIIKNIFVYDWTVSKRCFYVYSGILSIRVTPICWFLSLLHSLWFEDKHTRVYTWSPSTIIPPSLYISVRENEGDKDDGERGKRGGKVHVIGEREREKLTMKQY